MASVTQRFRVELSAVRIVMTSLAGGRSATMISITSSDPKRGISTEVVAVISEQEHNWLWLRMEMEKAKKPKMSKSWTRTKRTAKWSANKQQQSTAADLAQRGQIQQI